MAIYKPCRPSWLRHEGPALFLDRDGVVIEDRDYLSDPDQVNILPGVAEAMREARAAGFALVGISNQSGLGRGFFTEDDFTGVMEKLDELLAAVDADFDGFFYCPHAPRDDCPCRKPRGGLLEEAARSLSWNPGHSWVVGDKVSDIALGRDHGMGAVLVRSGHGSRYEDETRERWGDDPRVMVADDLAEAWRAIRKFDAGGGGP